MSAVPQIAVTPLRPASVYSSSEKSAQLDDEKADVREDRPPLARVQGEDGDYLREDDESIGAVGLPWSKKGPALVLILLFVLGSNWSGAALGPLKSTLRKELKIKNAQYGVLASADSLINCILPILTGIAIDYYGPVKGALCASTFILIGQVLTAVGATIHKFPLMVVGQIILGFGSTAIETSQSKLYSHWFRGNYGAGAGIIGFVFGLDIGIGRVYNLAGKLSAVPIMQSTGSFIWSFWVPACMCAVALGVVILYALFERSVPVENRPVTGAMRARRRAEMMGVKEEKKRVTVKTRWEFMVLSVMAIPACFWIVTVTQLLQAGAVNAYLSNLADMVEQTRGTTKLTAGYTSSLGQVMPIVLTPLLGIAFDRFGRRMHLVTATAALWVLVFALLGFTQVHPMVPTILGSLALSTNTLPFICSIPLLVPSQANLGTAFGIWKAFNSSGSTILDVATGAIQDLTPKGPRQYTNVFYLLIALKSVDVFYGMGYHLFDTRYLGGILRASERDRVRFERTESASDRSVGLRRPMRQVTWLGVSVAVALIVCAYVVYIVYALGT